MAGMAAGATALAACSPGVVTQIVEQTKVVTQVVNQTAVVAQTQVVNQVVTPTSAPVTITGICDSNGLDVHNAAVTAYQAIHPNVSVKFAITGIPGSIAPWLAAGNAPDFFRTDLNTPSQFGQKNLLWDWAPVMTNLGYVDAFRSAVWKGYMQPNGQVYAMPTDCNTFCMWSNPVVLKNAGVTNLPMMWADFIEACKAIAKPDKTDDKKSIYAFGIPTTIGWTTFFMQWWLWREGGDYYDGQKLIFKDGMIAAFTKLRGLITDGYLPAIDSWQTDYWYKGQLGMEEFGQWMIPADIPGPWNDDKPKGSWTGAYERPTFGLSPMIRLENTVPNYTILAGFGDISAKTSKNFEETAKYAFFEVNDPTAGQMWVTPYNQLPVIKSIKHPWLETPAYDAFLTQINTTKPFSMYPEIAQLKDNEWVSPTLDALSGKLKPEEAVQKMYDLGNPVCAEYQALR